VASTDILAHPTVAAIAELIRQHAADPGGAPKRSAAAASPVLVPIRASGERAPLFCVHPVGGTTFVFQALASHLPASRPVYGLRAQGIETGELPIETVEEMAEVYVRAVREMAGPPYLLIGSSMGGMVAFEMARQLQRGGLPVAFVGLLDTPGPGKVAAFRDDAELFNFILGDAAGLDVETLRLLPREELFRRAMGVVTDGRALAPSLDRDQAERLLNTVRANRLAMSIYQVPPYEGRVTLFRVAESDFCAADEPELAWKHLALGGLEIQVVGGTHPTMLSREQAPELARRLEQCIRERERVLAGAATVGAMSR